jgi:DNA-binding PadR family transcriptional regulator
MINISPDSIVRRSNLNKSKNKKERKNKLSAKEVILLGLIAEEPIHPYGLEEKIRHRQMTEWTEIGFSSIYRVVGQLEEKGLIETKLEHEGQGATRKVHSINEAGRKELAAGVLNFLASLAPPKNPFVVGLAFITHAPYEQALETLQNRIESLKEMQSALKTVKEKHQGEALESETLKKDHKRWISVQLLFDHILHHVAADKKSVGEAVERIIQGGKAPFFKTEVDK